MACVWLETLARSRFLVNGLMFILKLCSILVLCSRQVEYMYSETVVVPPTGHVDMVAYVHCPPCDYFHPTSSYIPPPHVAFIIRLMIPICLVRMAQEVTIDLLDSQRNPAPTERMHVFRGCSLIPTVGPSKSYFAEKKYHGALVPTVCTLLVIHRLTHGREFFTSSFHVLVILVFTAHRHGQDNSSTYRFLSLNRAQH